MSKFNLTFSGEIVAGVNPSRAKSRFGKMFQIEDPERIEKFFSGDTITLRRNLDRKTAAQYYSDMQKIGLVGQLVKATTRDTVDALAGKPDEATGEAAKPEAKPEPKPKTKPKTKTRTRRKAKPAARKPAAKRKVGEDAAQKKAAEEEARCRAEEEAARKKAEEEEARRRADEEAALKRAEQEARRQAEAEAARRKAEEEEARRRAEEEAARKKAEEEESRRRAEEEAARKKAEEEEARRRAEEEAARKKAEEEEARRKVLEEAARKRAEEEEAARRKAEENAARAKAAEGSAAQAAKQDAPRDNTTKKRAAGQARKKGTPRPKKKAPARKKKATPKQQPASTAKSETRPASRRVKTSLEVPHRNKTAPPARKRQPGEPNLYQLRPFRNSQEVKGRAALAKGAARRSLVFAVLAIAAVLLLSWQAGRFAPVQVIDGASAVAIIPGSGPVLVAGDKLVIHNRAGIAEKTLPLGDLGLARIPGPMAFNASAELIAWAQPAETGAATQLVRCNLEQSTCATLGETLAGVQVDAFVINPIDNSLLVADAAAGELLKVSPDGAIAARADVAIPANPSLVLNSGLLFMNSALGPAVSVFRYDDNAFGQQLDEVLLVPPPALEAGQTAPGSIARLEDAWWVNLRNPETGSQGFYRYDNTWNYLGALGSETVGRNARLIPWAKKMLLNDGASPRIQRFNAQGQPEVAFVSSSLEELAAGSHRRAGLVELAWRVTLIACTLLAALALLRAHLQRLRALVYKSGRERGAEPVEDHAESLVWVDHAENRQARFRQRGASYAVLVLACVALAISQDVAALTLAALLVAAAGPAIALLLVAKRSTGNIASLDRRLLLVDHRGVYQIGAGPRIQHRGGFLVIDDVIVHTGNRLLPAFSPQSFMEVAPQAIRGAVRVDRNTILVKLLEVRHPLAQGGIAILATAAFALCLLALHGIF